MMGNDSEMDALPNSNQVLSAVDAASFLHLCRTPPSASDILEELQGFEKHLRPYDPIGAAAAVAGLLTEPSLLANNLRLVILIHLLLACAHGTKKADVKCLESWINGMLGKSRAVYLEDPVEDVFISNVTTREGNFRIFEGTWECNDFHLQRLINIIETLPDDADVMSLQRHVTGALRLGEEIARRRQLRRFLPGDGQDKGKVRLRSAKALRALQDSIVFTAKDLSNLGVTDSDLAPFVLTEKLWRSLRNQIFQASNLQRHPIVRDGRKYYVLLPAALSIALRHYILDWMLTHGYPDSFDHHLVTEYIGFFSRTPILGPPVPAATPFLPHKVGDWTLWDFVKEVDDGRYIHILPVVDSISSYARFGLFEQGHNPLDLSVIIEHRANEARQQFESRPGFKQGLTLVVGCGFGRPMSVAIPAQPPHWHIECISAQDLETIAWIPRGERLTLWKLLGHMKLVRDHGVSFINPNGLLNLYGWWVNTDYLMVPAQLDLRQGPITLSIPTDCLTKVRQEVRQAWDVHSVSLPDGRKEIVRRASVESFFENDIQKSRYACIQFPRGDDLMGLYEGDSSAWWLSADTSQSGLSKSGIFQLWNAVHNWLGRAVPVLEKHVTELRKRPLLIVIDMNELRQDQVEPLNGEAINSCLSVSVCREEMKMRLLLNAPFMGAFRHPENVAERALLRALVQGVFMLVGRSLYPDLLNRIVREIVPNGNARYLHVFEAKQFHEYIQNFDRPEHLFIEDSDEARSKLGLGWLVQQGKSATHFESAKECVEFLNETVDAVWQRMRTSLRALNRVSLIERSLRYLEGLKIEERRWSRTFRATCALREDKSTASQVSVEQIGRVNAATIALRIVIEMALSECPLDGGDAAGILDVSPLMSDAGLLFHLGGTSDAIRKGVMEPEIDVAPCGDILADVGFRTKISERLGKEFVSARLAGAAERYTEHYDPFEPVPDVERSFPKDFLDAFRDECSVSLNELRSVRDALEDLAIQRRKCVFLTHEDDLLAECTKARYASTQSTWNVLKRFSLVPRVAWDKTPEGFLPKDWWPWRFGRRLSLLARPLVRLENCTNPRYLISPGLLAESIPYIVRRYYDAEVNTSECQTSTMKSWIDKERNRRGHEFVMQICTSIRSIGFETLIEQNMDALLGEKMDKDMGDVDVLAWKPVHGEMWAIECKSLRRARTPNEMAEQLNRFSGQMLEDGSRDELLKHLDRCELLRKKKERLAATLGIKASDLKINVMVCFSKPVPMQCVSEHFPEVVFVTADDLHTYFQTSGI